MRVFVAIDLPDDIRKALADLQNDLRPAADSAKWVDPESIHITLKFIGEVAEQKIEEIDLTLATVSWKPLVVTVKNVGFFPGSLSPRVFWVGMEASTMAGLAEALDTRLERIGIEKEKRAFRPHITLARSRDSRFDSGLVTAAAKYETHELGSFTVDRIYLVQSTLSPEGAVYTKLKEYPLARP